MGELPENLIVKRYRAICLNCRYRSNWYLNKQDAISKLEKHIEKYPNHEVVIETEERINRYSLG